MTDEITVTFTMDEAGLRRFVEDYTPADGSAPYSLAQSVAVAVGLTLPARTHTLWFEDLAEEAMGKTVVRFNSEGEVDGDYGVDVPFVVQSITILQGGDRINVNSNPGGLGMGGIGATILANGWIDVLV